MINAAANRYFPDLDPAFLLVAAQLSLFASDVFFVGALLLFLSATLTFTNLELMILHRYPSTALLKDHWLAAQVYRIATVVALVGSVMVSSLLHLCSRVTPDACVAGGIRPHLCGSRRADTVLAHVCGMSAGGCCTARVCRCVFGTA
jgi:hypothetical protein